MPGHETFILTIFHNPVQRSDLRGRLRHVTSGREGTFFSPNELVRLLRQLTTDGAEHEEGNNETQT